MMFFIIWIVLINIGAVIKFWVTYTGNELPKFISRGLDFIIDLFEDMLDKQPKKSLYDKLKYSVLSALYPIYIIIVILVYPWFLVPYSVLIWLKWLFKK